MIIFFTCSSSRKDNTFPGAVRREIPQYIVWSASLSMVTKIRVIHTVFMSILFILWGRHVDSHPEGLEEVEFIPRSSRVGLSQE